MAETPEGKVKRWLRDKMKDMYPGAWHYAPPGGAYGKAGTADDMWIIRAGKFAVVVVIESKADETKEPTVLQWKCLRETAANGAVSAVMRGKDHVKLAQIKEAIDKRIRLLEGLSESVGDL